MANNVEHLFTCLWAFCASSLEKYLFRSFTHFEIGLLFVFLLLSHIMKILKEQIANFLNHPETDFSLISKPAFEPDQTFFLRIAF